MLKQRIVKLLKIGALVNLLFPLLVKAQLQSNVISEAMKQSDTMAESAGFNINEGSIAKIVAQVIYGFLGLLGIIFIILILISGYNWMTAGGEEQKVEKAKQYIKRAIIGLIICVAAYSITYFVFSALDKAGTLGGGSSLPTMPP